MAYSSGLVLQCQTLRPAELPLGAAQTLHLLLCECAGVWLWFGGSGLFNSWWWCSADTLQPLLHAVGKYPLAPHGLVFVINQGTDLDHYLGQLIQCRCRLHS
jgi:hypothetical protein